VIMYAGQTDWQHESRVCVHYVLHWLSHGWINENVTEWIVLNLGSSGPSITSLLSTLSWTLPGTGSGNVDWFAAPFPTKWTVHWHLKSVSTSFALNHWPTDGFMQCKTALLGSKPEGADVYISPHTRNSEGAVAPSAPPGSTLMFVWFCTTASNMTSVQPIMWCPYRLVYCQRYHNHYRSNSYNSRCETFTGFVPSGWFDL